MDEKLKAIANEMMETFQKQGLTYREVDAVLMNMSMRVDMVRENAVKELQFTAVPF